MEPYKNRVIARFALIEVRANRGPPVVQQFFSCLLTFILRFAASISNSCGPTGCYWFSNYERVSYEKYSTGSMCA